MDRVWRWPNDYTPLDDGRLLVRPDYLPAFTAAGWKTVAALLADEAIHVVRRVGGRDNCKLNLRSEAGRETTAYLKRHRQQVPRWSGGDWRPDGLAEADAVGWCREAQVPTMEVIAAGRTSAAGGSVGSFFMSEQIVEGTPADDFWRAHPEPEVRARVLDAMADAARDFHQAGLYHRDFYWCHFFIRPAERGRFAAHLIDLQRVLRRPWLRARWLVKDLGQFWYSAPRDLTAADRSAWLSRYRKLDKAKTPLWRRLAAQALDYAAGSRAAFYRLKDGQP